MLHAGRVAAKLILAGLLAFPVSAVGEDSEQVRERLEALREEIQAISESLESRRTALRREQTALAEAERELGRLTLNMRETETALAETGRREAELSAQVARSEDQLDATRNRLAEQLQLAYRSGNRSRLQALLNLDEPARLSRIMALHGYLGRARLEAIEELDARRAELETLHAEQLRNAEALQRLLARQRDERQANETAMQRRQAAFESLAGAIADDESRLAELREAEAELEELLERLADALADIAPETEVMPFDQQRGSLPMPVNARVKAGFSDARGRDVAWQGWLIEADEGTPVQAVAWGRVAYADWLRGYGMMIIIDHGDGWMTLYGQNRSLTASVGDWVAPGEIIALAGDSGGGDTPGLYFQIRQDGRPVDPAGWMMR